MYIVMQIHLLSCRVLHVYCIYYNENVSMYLVADVLPTTYVLCVIYLCSTETAVTSQTVEARVLEYGFKEVKVMIVL